jgi:uncharacterized delta-60 repeat protein
MRFVTVPLSRSLQFGALLAFLLAPANAYTAVHAGAFSTIDSTIDSTVSSIDASAGDLDPTFGTGGRVTTDFGSGDDRANAVAIQSDGKIVATGSASYAFALARYNADGSLDGSFGSGGKVTTDFGPGVEFALAVAIQTDGKIVAGGEAAPGGYCCQFALARYNPDGSLDTTFDGDGRVTTNFPGGGANTARAIAIQSDGKIVAAGGSHTPFVDVFALARYNTDGSLDATFDGDGRVITDFGGTDWAAGVVVQADGKIVAAGAGGLTSDFALARYYPDGSLDVSFDGDGKATVNFGGGDRAADVTIQADGKMVAAGTDGAHFALARCNPDGSLDTTFDGDGMVTTYFGENYASAAALALQDNGEVVAAGLVVIDFDTAFALARYNADGNLDGSFGSGGRVTTDFGTLSDDRAADVAIQPADGKIVAAGAGGSASDFALARYAGDPPPDSDGDGISDYNDNCPDTPNTDQANTDGDATGDACDSCPDEPGPPTNGGCPFPPSIGGIVELRANHQAQSDHPASSDALPIGAFVALGVLVLGAGGLYVVKLRRRAGS